MSVFIAEDRRQLIKEMIQEFSRRLHDAEGKNLKQIVVFGSVARGEEKDGSDIDIFVLVEKIDLRVRDRIYDIAYAVDGDMCSHRIMISPFVVGLEEYEKAKDSELVFHFIKKDGALIYDIDAF